MEKFTHSEITINWMKCRDPTTPPLTKARKLILVWQVWEKSKVRVNYFRETIRYYIIEMTDGSRSETQGWYSQSFTMSLKVIFIHKVAFCRNFEKPGFLFSSKWTVIEYKNRYWPFVEVSKGRHDRKTGHMRIYKAQNNVNNGRKRNL